MYQPAKQPQSISHVLDNGLRLYQTCFKRIFTLTLLAGLVGLPATLEQMPSGTRSLLHPQAINLHSALFWGLLSFVIKVIFEGAVVHALASTARGILTGIRDNLSTCTRKLPAMVVAAVCYTVAVGLGTIALILPGIWLAYSLVLFPVPVLMENLGPLKGLEKSYDTVKGHWWRTTTVLTVIGIIIAALYLAAFTVVGAATGISLLSLHSLFHPEALARDSSLFVWAAILNAVLNALLSPLGYAMAVAQYEDLSLRHSGDDLEERIGSVMEG